MYCLRNNNTISYKVLLTLIFIMEKLALRTLLITVHKYEVQNVFFRFIRSTFNCRKSIFKNKYVCSITKTRTIQLFFTNNRIGKFWI